MKILHNKISDYYPEGIQYDLTKEQYECEVCDAAICTSGDGVDDFVSSGYPIEMCDHYSQQASSNKFIKGSWV